MIQPLSKEIYQILQENNIEKLILRFSGGSDEGYLDIDTEGGNHLSSKIIDRIEDWVWETFDYSGAGDGNNYGDILTYNLKDMTVEHEEWYMQPTSTFHNPQNLEIDKS